MTGAEIYRDAYHAYEPQPDDRPDGISFYRAWAGLRAAWGDVFCKKYDAILHRACCMAYRFSPEEGYAIALSIVEESARQADPPRPSGPYSSNCPPRLPREDDARNLFKSEFRRAFPGKRLNSREANRLWIEKRAQAMEIVQARYRERCAQYEADEKLMSDERAARVAEWGERCQRNADFRQAVEALPR